MRRVLAAGALLLGALAGPAGVAATTATAAPVAPFLAATMDGNGTDGDLGADFVSDPGRLQFNGTTAQLQFLTQSTLPGDSVRSLQVYVTPPTGQSLVAGTTYATTGTGAAGTVSLTIVSGSTRCEADAGTLSVTDIATSGSTVTEFAGDYAGVSCSGRTSPAGLGGSLRADTGVGFPSVLSSPRSWNFGDQYVGDNSIGKKITFTNTGTQNVTVTGKATLTGTSSAFRITADTCATAGTIAPGGTCSVIVAAHPVSSTGTSTAALTLPMSGIAPRSVPLATIGHKYVTSYVEGGPQRVTLHWAHLPAPVGATLGQVDVYRGTSTSVQALWRTEAPGATSLTDTTVRAGTTYYYSVQPVMAGDHAGIRSPLMAADPWPKYSAGMYHRVTSFRVLSGHHVVAGHPYVLRIGGVRGVPTSHIEAVALVVTAAAPGTATDVTVYPTGSYRPGQADLVVPRGQTVSNFVLARVDSHGRVTIAVTHGSTPVNVDVYGYFSASGLTTHGYGAALHEYAKGGTIMDTQSYFKKPLAAGYEVDAPVNFDYTQTPHITSLLVVITASGSTASGTITGYPTNGHYPPTSVLSYRAGAMTTGTAIIAAGPWTDPKSKHAYPSVTFVNRGHHAVQLKVTIIGYFDDGTYTFGQRYTPTSPVHLLAATFHTLSTHTITPGAHGTAFTTAMNVKVSVGLPSRSTSIALWPRGLAGITAPAQPQIRAVAYRTVLTSTLAATGVGNRFSVKNLYGTNRINVWSFGRFDAWPVPTTQSYVGPSSTSIANATPNARAATDGGLDALDALTGSDALPWTGAPPAPRPLIG